MFCSWRARQTGDQIHGSATEAPVWLCIELPTPWPAKAIRDADWTLALRTRLGEWSEALPGLRVQGVRREVNQPDRSSGVTVLAGRTGLHDPHLFRLSLPDVQALAQVDLPALLDDSGPPPSVPGSLTRVATPVVLTCTNGKRDRCCAMEGRAMHQALVEVAGDAAWQTTHLGGHRFAPTIVVLPYGLQYGWLAPDDATGLWTALNDGRLYRRDRYRGHVGFERPVQAAAIFLRDLLDLDAIGALELVSVRTDGDTWRVQFAHPGGTHEIRLDAVPGPTVPSSCGADPTPQTQYRLQGKRAV